MGVYINMEMPTSCAFCKLKRRNGKKMICPLLNEEWDIRDPMSADFKLDNCPLVPVPPHGRLIDADAMDAYLKTAAIMADGEAKEAYIDARAEARTMPVIIPEEEGET